MLPLLFFFGFFANLYGQNEPLSIEQYRAFLKEHPHQDSIHAINLLHLASKVRYQNIEEAIQLSKKALMISQNLQNKALEAKANNSLGICFGMQSRYSEAIQAFEDAVLLQKEIKQHAQRASSLNNLGIIYKKLKDYNQSISFYKQSWALHDSLNNLAGLARSSNNLGNLYRSNKDFSQAEESFNKAINYYQQSGNKKGLSSARINLAILKTDLGELNSAQILLDSAYQYVKAQNLDSETLITEIHLGKIAIKNKQYQKAEEWLSLALQKAESLELIENQTTIFALLAQLESERGNFKESLKYAQKANNYSEALNQLGIQTEVKSILTEIYEKAGDWEKAYFHFREKITLEDSISRKNTEDLYKSKQVQLEVIQKNRELEVKALQLDLANNKLAAQKRWQWFLGILGVLGLLAGFSFYQRFRQKQRFNGQLAQQNQLISLQKSEIDQKNALLTQQYTLRKQTDDAINYFATSLFGKNKINEILWDVTQNCIAQLGFVDCVIYLVDKNRNILVQKAAHGPKNPIDFEINNPIEIPMGKGIVGTVAQTGQPELIPDTSKDARYITDLNPGLSELAVPLIQNGEVIGVLDSEHPEKNFFTQYHLDALKTIASIAANKIAQTQADEAAQQARQLQVEAEQLKKMDQLKTKFFANVSHELRTPLNLILSPLQKKQTTILTEDITLIRRNAKRLLQLVNQILDLTKIEVGLMRLNMEPIEVNGFLSELAAPFALLAEAKQIHYQVDIPERDYIVSCDPDKLEKIVYNLLANAFKFTAKGGKISIHVAHDRQNSIRITISDSGIGIPEKQLGKVFNRFYQADSKDPIAHSGTGIGLSLTKELVDLMGGTIDVDSQEGRGSVFTVNLPMKFLQDAALASDKLLHPDLNSVEELMTTSLANTPETTLVDAPLLLVVEDHEELNQYLQRELSQTYNVLSSLDGLEGLELAEQKIPDIIISDIMMPNMDGIEMARALQINTSTAHIPLIFLTAKGDEKTRIESFEGGAEQFLVKPFDILELKTRIKGLLDKRAILKEKYGRAIQLPISQIQETDPNTQFLKKLIQIVEENLDNEQFSVSDLQQSISMSRMQLHRKLKALLGQSASEFIRSIRLQKAAEYLAQPGYQVQEVAYNVGFTHLSYFAKCFKEQFGVAPSEYRVHQ